MSGSDLCADLGARRVCWRGASARLVARVTPRSPPTPDGYRCGGMGEHRVCEDRARNASGFECGTQRCLQTRPRMPDDGEWDCVEISGVVFCRSRGNAAGMTAGPIDLGWICGQRRGAPGERVCVDLDPDRPHDSDRTLCRFERQSGVAQRSCTAAATPLVGGRCDQTRRCPPDTNCELGLCLPQRPDPACWLDRDCAAGERCAFATCVRS